MYICICMYAYKSYDATSVNCVLYIHTYKHTMHTYNFLYLFVIYIGNAHEPVEFMVSNEKDNIREMYICI